MAYTVAHLALTLYPSTVVVVGHNSVVERDQPPGDNRDAATRVKGLKTERVAIRPGLSRIETFVPEEWIGDRIGRGVGVVCYEVQGLLDGELKSPFALALKSVRVVFFHGEAHYREEVTVTRFWIDDQGRFNVVDPEPTAVVKAPLGTYAMFLAPFQGAPDDDSGRREAEVLIDIATGLVGSFQGRNAIFRQVYINSYSFETRRASSWSETITVPLSFPKPEVTARGLTPILAADDAIHSLSTQERDRVQLSLRWMREAMFDSGVNAVLKYWFAIEILSMQSDTNIRRLNQLLQKIYQLSSTKEANETFHTGLLASLRSRIAHGGRILPIDGRILKYMDCMYFDVLRHIVGLPTERRLSVYLSSTTYDLREELRLLAKA